MKILIVLLVVLVLTTTPAIASVEMNPQIIKVVSYGDDVVVPVEFTLDDGRDLVISSTSYENFIGFYDGENYFDEVALTAKGTKVKMGVVLKGMDLPEGVYVGSVTAQGKKFPVIFGINDLQPIYAVSASIPAGTGLIGPGDALPVEIAIHAIRPGAKEVSLEYSIFDLEGERIYHEEENYEVPENLRFLKEFKSSEDEGSYVLAVKLTDSAFGRSTTSSILFTTSSSGKGEDNLNIPFVFVLVVLFIVASFFVFNYYWKKTVEKKSDEFDKKLDEINREKFSTAARKIRKLERQLDALEEAYSKKYISKASYIEGRKKINSMIAALKKRL